MSCTVSDSEEGLNTRQQLLLGFREIRIHLHISMYFWSDARGSFEETCFPFTSV